MDPTTAGIALAAVQLGIAVMLGASFSITPKERCTRYWAQAAAVLALGVVITLANRSQSSLLFIASNACFMGGVILQWQGTRAFLGRAFLPAAGVAFGGFLALFAFALAVQAPMGVRVVLNSGALALVFAAQFREVRSSDLARSSPARALALFATGLLCANFALRALIAVFDGQLLAPLASNVPTVVLAYLIPLVGTLLLSSAFLLLYFERVVGRERQLAAQDDVTGQLNRRAFFAAARAAAQRCERNGLQWGIGYLDVDHFKRINDDFGHARGDEVLAHLGRLLAGICGEHALVGRVGGDELAIFLPGAGAQDAHAAGVRIVQAVREQLRCGSVAVTASIGIAVNEAGNRGRAWRDLLSEADQALYVAKATGRDTHYVWRAGADVGREEAPAAGA